MGIGIYGMLFEGLFGGVNKPSPWKREEKNTLRLSVSHLVTAAVVAIAAASHRYTPILRHIYFTPHTHC